MQNYNEQGYAIIENFITDEEINALKQRAHDLIEDFHPEEESSIFHSFFNGGRKEKDKYILDSASGIHFFLEAKAMDQNGKLLRPKQQSICKIGHAMHDLDPVFDKFSRNPKVKAVAKEIGFKNPLLSQSMYFFKNPGIAGEIGLHQDASFIYTTPSSVVGFWFALEDATIENSCLWVLPRGHQKEVRSVFERTNDGLHFQDLGLPEFNSDEFIPLEVKKGTLVLLHGNLPHYSTENHSNVSRHAYTLHLIEGNYPYSDKNWLQRSAEMPFRGF